MSMLVFIYFISITDTKDSSNNFRFDVTELTGTLSIFSWLIITITLCVSDLQVKYLSTNYLPLHCPTHKYMAPAHPEWHPYCVKYIVKRNDDLLVLIDIVLKCHNLTIKISDNLPYLTSFISRFQLSLMRMFFPLCIGWQWIILANTQAMRCYRFTGGRHFGHCEMREEFSFVT